MSSAATGAKAALGAAAVLLALALLYLIRPVLVILIVSIIFAQAISPLVLRLRRLGARRAPAVLAIYLLILLALAALVWQLWQAISSQVVMLVAGLPQLQEELRQLAERSPIPGVSQSLRGVLSGSLPTIQPGQAVPGVLNTVRALVEGVFAVFSVFVVTFYWIRERLAIRRSFLRLLPARHRERGLTIWDDVEEKIGLWVRGELLVMLGIGAAFALGLGLMGVKFWLLLALFAALAEIIPLAGPYIGTVPAVLVALTQSIQLALMVAGFGLIVQLLENNVLVPRIMGHATGVSPLTVILGILIGATLAGIAGALLAVPVAATVQVLLTDLDILSEEDRPLEQIAEQRRATRRDPVRAGPGLRSG